MESHLSNSISPHSSSSSETNILEHIITTTLKQASINRNTNNTSNIAGAICTPPADIVAPTDHSVIVSNQIRRSKQISSELQNDNNAIRRHPCSPRPQFIRPQTTTKKKKKKRRAELQFNNQALKPVMTPRENVDTPDDDMYDDDSENNDDPHVCGLQYDDIYAEDRYRTIKQQKFEKKAEENKYHSYQVEEKEISTKEKSSIFTQGELCDKYTFVRVLGRGAFGVVAEGIHRTSGKRVAIKKILKVFRNAYDAKRLLRELRICRLLSGHDSVVELIDILPPNDVSTFTSLVLVFNFCDSDLYQIIYSNQFLSEPHVQYILYQLLLGVQYMHGLNIYHRDLKPANILINSDCSIQICDFGLSRSTKYNNAKKMFATKYMSMFSHNIQQDKPYKPCKLTHHVQTRWYRAPEVILLEQTVDNLAAVDMWSVGCIFGELLQMLKENIKHYNYRKPLFPGDSSLLSPVIGSYSASTAQLAVIFDIVGTPTPEDLLSVSNPNAVKFLEQKFQKRLPSKLEKRFRGTYERECEWNKTHQNKKNCFGLLRGFLQFDVEKRVTANEALSHPFIAEVRDQENERKWDQLLNQVRHQNDIKFEFEDKTLSIHQYRELIIEEILMYQ